MMGIVHHHVVGHLTQSSRGVGVDGHDMATLLDADRVQLLSRDAEGKVVGRGNRDAALADHAGRGYQPRIHSRTGADNLGLKSRCQGL